MIFNFFINISRYVDSNAKRNTPLCSEFYALQDDIFFEPFKFAFSNPRFSPFYEHYRQLREKYAFKLKIKYTMLIATLLTHFMKEYCNSFDDIQFFHTFSSISRDMQIVTLSEIHRYVQNFMLYKMIYFSSHNMDRKMYHLVEHKILNITVYFV